MKKKMKKIQLKKISVLTDMLKKNFSFLKKKLKKLTDFSALYIGD